MMFLRSHKKSMDQQISMGNQSFIYDLYSELNLAQFRLCEVHILRHLLSV